MAQLCLAAAAVAQGTSMISGLGRSTSSRPQAAMTAAGVLLGQSCGVACIHTIVDFCWQRCGRCPQMMASLGMEMLLEGLRMFVMHAGDAFLWPGMKLHWEGPHVTRVRDIWELNESWAYACSSTALSVVCVGSLERPAWCLR